MTKPADDMYSEHSKDSLIVPPPIDFNLNEKIFSNVSSIEPMLNKSSKEKWKFFTLCFLSFASVSLILVGIFMLNLLSNINRTRFNSHSHEILGQFDETLRQTATILALLMVLFNCFSLLNFSLQISMRFNANKTQRTHFNFIGMCTFYASIPTFLLVLCFYILLNLSLIPALVSLTLLGLGLVLVLMILVYHFYNSFQPIDEFSTLV